MFYQGSTPKIINIDIGESNISSPKIIGSDFTYDRHNVLSANNKTSTGYKTVVSVIFLINQLPTSNRVRVDTESCRKADEKHLGYGVLRKLFRQTHRPAFQITNRLTFKEI